MTAWIQVGPSTFRRGGAGPSTGEIWLLLGHEAFPMPRWNDFVIVILNAWSQALLRIVRAESAAERVYFMEGPYHVELTPSGNGQVRLKAIARPSTERTHEDISESELLANLLEVVATMLEAAHKSGDTSPDVLQLEALLQELHSARELSLLSGE